MDADRGILSLLDFTTLKTYIDRKKGEKGKYIQQIYTNILNILSNSLNKEKKEASCASTFTVMETQIVKTEQCDTLWTLLNDLSKDTEYMRYMACYVRGLYMKGKQPNILKNIDDALGKFKEHAASTPDVPAAEGSA